MNEPVPYHDRPGGSQARSGVPPWPYFLVHQPRVAIACCYGILCCMPKPKDIDAYLATVSADKRALLQALRETIHAIVPEAEECISYAMPAFRVKGGVVAGFLATTKGCSYFPFSGSTLSTLAEAVAGYARTKSALHFDGEHRLPKVLVRKLIKARLAEMKK